jgi:hypothetical protein
MKAYSIDLRRKITETYEQVLSLIFTNSGNNEGFSHREFWGSSLALRRDRQSFRSTECLTEYL